MTHLCLMTRLACGYDDSLLVLGLGYIRTLGGTANLIRPRLVSYPIITRLALIFLLFDKPPLIHSKSLFQKIRALLTLSGSRPPVFATWCPTWVPKTLHRPGEPKLSRFRLYGVLPTCTGYIKCTWNGVGGTCEWTMPWAGQEVKINYNHRCKSS